MGSCAFNKQKLNSNDNMPVSVDPAIDLPLLITGVAGVAGYNAFHYFRRRYGDQVIGQRPVNNWPLRGDGIVACDLEDRKSLRSLARKFQFRSVLSCGGSCALKSCELDPNMAHRVNVLGVDSMLEAIQPHPARLVHLSIDLVFSGTRGGNHRESDRTDPVTVYGKTMVLGEQLVATRRPDACILRISLPMGISFNGHAGAIDWIQSRFAKNKPATLYYDEVRTPTYVQCLNRTIHRLLSLNASGLFHAGGPRQMSLFQIAQVVNRVGGYPPHLLEGCPRKQAGPLPPRAGNVSMDSSKLHRLLGENPFEPWPLLEHHIPTDRHWHWNRDSRWGSPSLLRRVLYKKPANLVLED